MEDLSKLIVDLTLDALNNIESKEAHSSFRVSILNALSHGLQIDIDNALSYLEEINTPAYIYLKSFINWHICHQTKELVGLGPYFLTQILIPVTVKHYGLSLKTDISPMALRTIGEDLMAELGLCKDSILMFAEEYQSIETLSMSETEAYRIPEKMNSKDWPYYEFIESKAGTLTVFIYVMVMEPLSKDGIICNKLDGDLNNPAKLFDWQSRADTLIKADFGVKKIEYESLSVGKPSTYSLSLHHAGVYDRVAKVCSLMSYNSDNNHVFSESEKQDCVVIINEDPETKNVGITVYSNGNPVLAVNYGHSTFAHETINNQFYDKDILKNRILYSGFDNIIMESKIENTEDLDTKLSKGIMRLI